MTTFYQLDQFGFLGVTGVDAVKFMQGYTTCDLERLEPGQVQMGAVCNLQGRMLSSFLVIARGQDLLLRLHRDLVEPTMAFLGKYIVFSRAELQDRSEELVCYGSLDAGDNGVVDDQHDQIIVYLGNRREHWLPADTDLSAEADATPFIEAEIEAGVAWVNETSSEQYLPQMFNYHGLNAVDFGKGCYLGQEIVARAQYRGGLKRKLHRLPVAIPIGEIDGGAVVASAPGGSLAVLSNSTNDAVDVTVSGESLTATPVH